MLAVLCDAGEVNSYNSGLQSTAAAAREIVQLSNTILSGNADFAPPEELLEEFAENPTASTGNSIKQIKQTNQQAASLPAPEQNKSQGVSQVAAQVKQVVVGRQQQAQPQPQPQQQQVKQQQQTTQQVQQAVVVPSGSQQQQPQSQPQPQQQPQSQSQSPQQVQQQTTQQVPTPQTVVNAQPTTAAAATSPQVVTVVPASQSSSHGSDSKLDQAKQFNLLVKNINSILDDAMLKLKDDNHLYKRAVADRHAKQSDIKEKASSAKEDASGDAAQIEAIDTHVALAAKASAKAFIEFSSGFRESAKEAFWSSYNDAEARQAKLEELYDSITSHVAHAVNAMQAQGVQLNDKYLDSAKAYYKAKYKARYGCEKAADQDAAAKKACQEEPHTAKDDMKKAHDVLSHFQENLETAHHHGKKLKKGLKEAMDKLHYVFQKARHDFRHTEAEFHAGFDMHYNAQKAVSTHALKKLEEEEKKQDKEQKREKADASAEIDAKDPEEDADDDRSAETPEEQAADTKAEMKAVNVVTKAAKAILKQTSKSHRAQGMIATRSRLRGTPHGAAVQKTKAKDKQAEKTAEKKAVSIVKNAIMRAGKQAHDAEVSEEEFQLTQVVPEAGMHAWHL